MVAPVRHIDEKLLDWATETQAKYLRAVNEHGSYAAAARAIGMHKSVLQRFFRLSIQRCRTDLCIPMALAAAA